MKLFPRIHDTFEETQLEGLRAKIEEELDEDGFVKTYAGIYHNEDGKESLLPVEKEDEWELIESKKYKNVKSAYNFIKKLLED